MKLPPGTEPLGNADDVEHEPQGRWRRFVSEPLLHFVTVGALLFGAYHLLTPVDDGATSTNQIVLTKDDIRQLAISWLAQGRSTPTPEQVRGLVDQKVRQEILFREAVSLGLDRDDEVVKRRLAQKMDFLASDVASLQEPTDAELKAWFEQNSETFALPAHATFRHLYFSTDRQGKGTKEAAAAALALVEGKVSGLQRSCRNRAIHSCSKTTMAAPLPIRWRRNSDRSSPRLSSNSLRANGADRSNRGYGWHLVWIDSIEPGRIPNYAEVMPNVRAGWIDDKYREIKNLALDEMRARYSVVVPPIEAADFHDLQMPPGFSLGLEVSAQ